MKIVQVVATNAFAGTERHVATLSQGLAEAGHDVTVVGGDRSRMREVCAGCRWFPGATPAAATARLARLGQMDIVHAHLTYAETAAVLTRRRHAGRVVATRHVVTPRGQSLAGQFLRPIIERGVGLEIAVSEFIADRVSPRPALVIYSGVAEAPDRYRSGSRTVVMAQRLQPDKDAETGIRAWCESALGRQGWRLVVAGDGPDRERLIRLAEADDSVEFSGYVSDLAPVWDSAGLVLAPTAIESLGLTVIEAMAAGLPVVAAAGGGHLESVGRLESAPLFTPGDVRQAAEALRSLAADPARRALLGAAGRALQRQRFTVAGQVGETERAYEELLAR